MIRLDHADLTECTLLLAHILSQRKVMEPNLGAEFPNLPRLHRCITALQLIGWLDRHNSDDGAFYVVPSDEAPAVQEILLQTGWLNEH